MNLDIGLPLLSEYEQLRRAFWNNQNHQHHSHNLDTTLDSHGQNHSSRSQKQSSETKLCSDNVIDHIELNHQTQRLVPSNTSNSCVDKDKHTQDNHDKKTENNQSCFSKKRDCCSHEKRHFCKSTSKDSSKNGCETSKNSSTSVQPKSKNEPSKPLQVNNSQLDQSDGPRRMCRVQWDSSTEDNSFL